MSYNLWVLASLRMGLAKTKQRSKLQGKESRNQGAFCGGRGEKNRERYGIIHPHNVQQKRKEENGRLHDAKKSKVKEKGLEWRWKAGKIECGISSVERENLKGEKGNYDTGSDAHRGGWEENCSRGLFKRYKIHLRAAVAAKLVFGEQG